MGEYQKDTQIYSTFGDKLLAHAEVLADIQTKGIWRPITVQLSLLAACDSHCDFCSVSRRDLQHRLKFEDVQKCIADFRELGAKAVEITGGGNPMMYPQINEVVDYAHSLGLDIGIISNTENPGKILKPETAQKLTWYRCSLTKLEEGKTVADFDFDVIPKGKLGFSHIMNVKTTPETIEQIAELVKRYPDVKFVRIAGNCLDSESIEGVKKDWEPIIKKVDELGKFFIKEIAGCHNAFPDFCGVGAIRPYVMDDGYIYICTSHVLKFRKVDSRYRIGVITDVKGMYEKMNKRFQETGTLYDVDIKGKCRECFYSNNNRLLNTIAGGYGKSRHPDANFA